MVCVQQLPIAKPYIKDLATNFHLPSPCFLKTLLSNIPFEKRFNPTIIQSLNAEISMIHEHDKYCALLSDDMSRACIMRKLIVLLIGELQKLGFKVVGMVCDQGSNNQKALNKLFQDNVNKSGPFCFISNSELIAVSFDVPHLLKPPEMLS
ncbi:hypothetical protein J437_LFUL008134 [Ladona fulva]|uniref:Transposable element P transposase n=1 Tax=Ladona fulva TaxID=123851 RepID=A0A8K0JU54_LADFU|nr:hypothetical protein J437_LFUL008134 [Ladona fulva]